MLDLKGKLKIWLPGVYLIVILLDVGFNLTDYQILAMLVSPPAWFNFFQHENTFPGAIVLSVVIWFMVGWLIDKFIASRKR